MLLRNVDLNLLPTLDLLLREKSVTRAAAASFVTQSAVSHSLARLREIFDDPLLVRAAGGLALTPLAEQLREPTRRALLSMELVLGKGKFEPPSATHVFTLGTTDYVDALVLPGVIECVRREAPQVRVLLRNLTVDQLGDYLERGEIDLTVSFAAKVAPFIATLYDETYCCVVARKSRRRRSTLSFDEYLAAPHLIVSPSESFSVNIDARLAELGRSRRVVMSTPRFLAAAEIVARSDMVLTIQTRLANRFLQHLPVRVFDLPFSFPAQQLAMQWSERTDGDPAHQWLRAHVAAAAA